MFDLVPDSLQYQWLVETLRRFNLMFSLFDEERLLNPSMTQLTRLKPNNLCYAAGTGCARKSPFEQVLECEWDLLVVDEAHHLGGAKSAAVNIRW